VHMPLSSVGPGALEALNARVADDLTYLDYPRDKAWTLPRSVDGLPVLDVLIVGGGQTGLSTAFALRRERIGSVLILDRNPEGYEGPWRTYARMHDLRTPKNVTGPDLGIPSLTPRAWFEARYGAARWEAIDSISREDWAAYLCWLRAVLALDVRNRCAVEQIVPAGQYLRVNCQSGGSTHSMLARKVVLATGFAGSGVLNVPEVVRSGLPARKFAHSAQPIDFNALRGRRVAVIGAGAAAFESAAVALETGAARVELFVRRPQVPRVNAFHWTDFAGVMGHFAELPDLYRWRFSKRLLEAGHPPPAGSLQRCVPFSNFGVRAGEPWLEVEDRPEGFRVRTPKGWSGFDFVICGTGNAPDARKFPPLAAFADQIATWADRFTPPAGEESPHLAAYPYLGPAFEFIEKTPGAAPLLRHIHSPNYCAQVSMGNSAGAPGLRFSIPRLVSGLVRDLFVDDADAYYRQFLEFKAPEPESIAFLNG